MEQARAAIPVLKVRCGSASLQPCHRSIICHFIISAKIQHVAAVIRHQRTHRSPFDEVLGSFQGLA